MSVDWVKLWEKGGVPLVMIVAVFLLFRFIGRRGVKALDHVATTQTNSMQMIATSVQTSSTAIVGALGQLTDRVSRMEGKVDTIGQLAMREVRAPSPAMLPQEVPVARANAMASAAEVFDEDEHTPVAPIPALPALPSPRQTPPGGAYAKHRPPTHGGGKR